MENKILKLIEALPSGMEAAMVTSMVNRRYFTGLRSSAGTLFVTKDKAYFIIDFRYIELARNTVKNAEVILQENLGEQLNALAKKHGVKTIGIDSGYVTMSTYMTMSNYFTEAKIAMSDELNKAIIDMRMKKSHQEYLYMQEAQTVADKAYADLLNIMKTGMTEAEVEMELGRLCKKHGAEQQAFIGVVAGKNTSMPHGKGGDYVIKDGDFLWMDYGVSINGYVSDMTRSVGFGTLSEKQKHVYETVLQSQLKALEVIKPGMIMHDVDKVARDYIDNAGYEGCFGHSLGHGIGTEVHEGYIRFAKGCMEICQPGFMLSVEPGIYLAGEFGIRIEDVVMITEDGYKNLTHSPKELIVLK